MLMLFFPSQLAITCSKVIIETQEQGVNKLKFKNKDNSMTPSKLTIKTPERRHLHCSDVFIVKFDGVVQMSL